MARRRAHLPVGVCLIGGQRRGGAGAGAGCAAEGHFRLAGRRAGRKERGGGDIWGRGHTARVWPRRGRIVHGGRLLLQVTCSRVCVG